MLTTSWFVQCLQQQQIRDPPHICTAVLYTQAKKHPSLWIIFWPSGRVGSLHKRMPSPMQAPMWQPHQVLPWTHSQKCQTTFSLKQHLENHSCGCCDESQPDESNANAFEELDMSGEYVWRGNVVAKSRDLKGNHIRSRNKMLQQRAECGWLRGSLKKTDRKHKQI